MKRYLLVSALILWANISFSQPDPGAKTVLYLIPFYSSQIEEVNAGKFTSDDDIYAVPSFQLTAFWEGAQIALKEFDDEGVRLNIIVRDVVDDAAKLTAIMEDSVLMQKVDLIIGPFYSRMFEIAARYALKYRIPILNPFSNRRDFLLNNEYVYKLIPSPEARPNILSKLLMEQYEDYELFFWVDETGSKETRLYEKIFREDSIPYQKIPFSSGVSALTAKLIPGKQNIVITYAQSHAAVINNFRNLVTKKDLPLISMVIPETWLIEISTELENFNKLEAYYFSNYYVDRKDDKTIYFESEFIDQFHSPPDILRFSYQGYDITRFFIQYLLHDFDRSKFNYHPLSLDFNFRKTENGGYENQRSRLLQLKDYEIIEIRR